MRFGLGSNLVKVTRFIYAGFFSPQFSLSDDTDVSLPPALGRYLSQEISCFQGDKGRSDCPFCTCCFLRKFNSKLWHILGQPALGSHNINRTFVAQQEIWIACTLSSLWKQLSKTIALIQWVLSIMKNYLWHKMGIWHHQLLTCWKFSFWIYFFKWHYFPRHIIHFSQKYLAAVFTAQK